MSRRSLDKVISYFNTAIRLTPKLAVPYINRGNVYVAKGDYELAIADYTKALEFDPKSAVAHNNPGLGLFQGRQGGGRSTGCREVPENRDGPSEESILGISTA